MCCLASQHHHEKEGTQSQLITKNNNIPTDNNKGMDSNQQQQHQHQHQPLMMGSKKRPSPSLPPSLEPISDESSLDDSSQSKRHKRVSWDKIQTREYTLVVGDHPMCQDGLPVSLGWSYNDGNSMELQRAMMLQQAQQQLQQQQQQHQQLQLSERRQSYAFPKRLSYEERRDRLVSVSNLTLDQIKNDEIDLVVRTLKESWSQETTISSSSSDDCNNNTTNSFDHNLTRDDDEEEDPLADIIGLEDVPGMDFNSLDDDGDLGDISNFEWN
jgi:outer membrane receptor for ferrienterochelin and colicin